MPHAGPDAERPERPHATDAQDDLLAQTHLAPAHVQDLGDRAIRRIVGRDVRVEQQERYAPDLCDPDGGPHGSPREVDAHPERRSIFAAGPAQWEVGRIQVGLVVLLVPVGIDLLPEVAVPVQETHRNEGEGGVRGGLAVVAGEDAEAP